MEDARKYRDVRIVTDPEQIVKLGSKLWYHSFDIIYDNSRSDNGSDTYDKAKLNTNNVIMMLMYMRYPTINLNKPIPCGAKILDLSKLHM